MNPTFEQLLQESRSKKIRELISSLTKRTAEGRLSWIVTENGQNVSCQFHERYGMSITEERSYTEDDEQTICDGATYRLSMYAFPVGCEEYVVSIEKFGGDLQKLFELAKKKYDSRQADVFTMVEQYIADVQREEALDMLVKIYNALRS